MFIIQFMNLISVHFWTYLENLDDEGIIVPEEFRYFPYPTTFDLECYFEKANANQVIVTYSLEYQCMQ